jgi:hypothetical protein
MLSKFKLNAMSGAAGWIPAQTQSQSLVTAQDVTHCPGAAPLLTGLQMAPGREHPVVMLPVQAWAFAACGKTAADIISAIRKEGKRAASLWLNGCAVRAIRILRDSLIFILLHQPRTCATNYIRASGFQV